MDSIVMALARHYKAIRNTTLMNSSTILYILESNLGREHEWLASAIEGHPLFDNVGILQEKTDVIGFRTNEKTKLLSDEILRTRVVTGGLSFADPIISVNEEVARLAVDPRQMLIDQIGAMREYTKIAGNGIARKLVTSTLSIDLQPIPGRKDDLQRALSTLLLVSKNFTEGTLPANYMQIRASRQQRRPDFITGRLTAPEPKRTKTTSNTRNVSYYDDDED